MPGISYNFRSEDYDYHEYHAFHEYHDHHDYHIYHDYHDFSKNDKLSVRWDFFVTILLKVR